MNICYRSWSFWALILISLSLAKDVAAEVKFLDANIQKCSNEGETVVLTNISKSQCYLCKCKNGLVLCDPKDPRTDGCHFQVEVECCKICKGCIYKGKSYLSYTEWTDPSNPCKVMRCEAGIVTISDMHCYTPCSNPLPPEPGKCCRTCPVCQINGQKVEENRDVVTENDSCLKCRCSRGRLTCSKKACPVLMCPVSQQVKEPDECCPKCTGNWQPFVPPGVCPFQRKIYREEFQMQVDACTNCQCLNGTSICTRKSCPILECPPENQKLQAGHCCPRCASMPQSNTYNIECRYSGRTFENGMVWKINECSSCKCNAGIVSCARIRCNTTCDSGMRTIMVPGECCPRCLERDGTCMAFGDPHYKTFDGKIYTFRGMGKYQLIEDCDNRTFSIKVANEVSKYMHSAITKRVTITFGDIRLNLQQRMRVKYNGQKLTLPFTKEGEFRVKKDNNAIEVRLQNDVVILWNGKSFLEVTVPPNYKGKLCGLCGNFNGKVKDDLKTKNGKIVNDDLVSFGLSWCVGKKSDCAKEMRYNTTKDHSKIRNCQYLKDPFFRDCESKLSNTNYYAACKMDMEHCVHKKCYCESLTAYARECQRLGVTLSDWQSYFQCNAQSSRKTLHKIHRPKSRKHSKYSSTEEFLRYVNVPKNIVLQSRKPIPVV